MAEDRMILKEKIKLQKEIGLVEGARSTPPGRARTRRSPKIPVEKEIPGRRGGQHKARGADTELEEQIAELDSEFKEAQLTAGRLRKMSKRSSETAERPRRKR